LCGEIMIVCVNYLADPFFLSFRYVFEIGPLCRVKWFSIFSFHNKINVGEYQRHDRALF
jgi:hypothetical protein